MFGIVASLGEILDDFTLSFRARSIDRFVWPMKTTFQSFLLQMNEHPDEPRALNFARRLTQGSRTSLHSPLSSFAFQLHSAFDFSPTELWISISHEI